jgi:S-adenosyl methyltransferase
MPGLPPEIDTSRPHPARVYDCLIGGKNNFAADRETVAQVLLKSPNARIAPRENRAFLGRAVRFLTGDVGLRQFLDVGSGLPTANNVHEVAQAVNPEARVVYVDNDPLVLVHARHLLTSAPEGRTAYIQADIRDPEAILAASAARELLDFSQPVGLLLLGILHLLADADKPAEIVATLLNALPSGSYLVASHLTMEHDRERTAAGQAVMRNAGITMQKRDSEVFAKIAFTGLELVPPGVVLVSEWRPDAGQPRPSPAEVSIYGGVARKPSRTPKR